MAWWLDVMLALVFALAALTDLRTRTIPEALPFAALALAAAYGAAAGENAPLLELLGGLALGAAAGGAAFAGGWVGGGGALLLAALGAASGASGAPWALGATAIAGGALAAAFPPARRRDVPYAVAIAAGFAFAWLARRFAG